MKIYNEHVALQSQKPREVLNLTTRIKAATEKSGMRDGVVVISSLHSNTSIIVTDDDPSLLQNLDVWLAEICPHREEFRPGRSESAPYIQLQSLLLHHQVVVPFAEGRLELGAQQAVFFVELDGIRPRRVVLKLMGE